MITVFGVPEDMSVNKVVNSTTFAFINGAIYHEGKEIVPPENAYLQSSIFVLANLPYIVSKAKYENEALIAYKLNNLDEFLALTICANKDKIFAHLGGLTLIPAEENFCKIIEKLRSPDFKVAKIFADDELTPEKKLKKACNWLLK